MSAREKPLDKRMAQFVEAHLGRGIFAPFTGTDYRAWRAWCHLLELYGVAADPMAVEAMRATLVCAQRKRCIWEVFVQTIPGVLDWNYVTDLWPRVVAAIPPNSIPRDIDPAAVQFMYAVDRADDGTCRRYGARSTVVGSLEVVGGSTGSLKVVP